MALEGLTSLQRPLEEWRPPKTAERPSLSSGKAGPPIRLVIAASLAGYVVVPRSGPAQTKSLARESNASKRIATMISVATLSKRTRDVAADSTQRLGHRAGGRAQQE